MPKVVFTANLERHLASPAREVTGSTVREALFAENPRLRGYVLDDQDRVRHHVVVFVDGQRIADSVHLSDPVPSAGEIYVMQALSGG
jgi:molybdopterin synthase sulfur carrier subunit